MLPVMGTMEQWSEEGNHVCILLTDPRRAFGFPLTNAAISSHPPRVWQFWTESRVLNTKSPPPVCLLSACLAVSSSSPPFLLSPDTSSFLTPPDMPVNGKHEQHSPLFIQFFITRRPLSPNFLILIIFLRSSVMIYIRTLFSVTCCC